MTPASAVSSDSDDSKPLWGLDRIEQALSWQILVILWIVLFQVLAFVYAPSFPSPFIYDDLANIVHNEDFRADNPVAAILSTHSDSMQFDRRPVGGLISWLNFRAFGLSVKAFRAVNLLIHWLCAGVLGIVVTQCARRVGFKWPWLFASVLAGFWALHPIHSSAVIYISQRMESLMTLFFLISCACLLHSHPERPRSGLWRIGSGVAACLCLLSKENGGGLFVVLLVIDRLWVAGSWRTLWDRHRLFYLVLGVIWAFILAWELTGQRATEWDRNPVLSSPWRYFQTECHIVFEYLRLLIWPAPLVFAPVPRIAETWRDWFPYLAALVGIFAVWAHQARRFEWLWVPWLTVLLVLAPTSSFIPMPLEPAFDYRMHLPSAAVFAVLLAGLWHLFIRLEWSVHWLLAGVAGCALALGGETRQRAFDFARPESIWLDVVEKEPENVKAWLNLSRFLMGAGRFDEARHAAEAAHATNQLFRLPWVEAEYHRALGLFAEHVGDWAEVERQFSEAASFQPDRPEFRLAHARSLIHQKRPAEALVVLEALSPVWTSHPEVVAWRAVALAMAGRVDEAKAAASSLPTVRSPSPILTEALQLLRDTETKTSTIPDKIEKEP